MDLQVFKIYAIVMAVICAPLYLWALVSINNQNRQKMFGEDPRDQVGCGKMIAILLLRVVWAVAPYFIAAIFLSMWASDPSGNIVFCLFTVYVVLLAGGASKAWGKFNGS